MTRSTTYTVTAVQEVDRDSHIDRFVMAVRCLDKESLTNAIDELTLEERNKLREALDGD